MNGWVDGQMDKRMDGWMDGQMDEWMDILTFVDIENPPCSSGNGPL